MTHETDSSLTPGLKFRNQWVVTASAGDDDVAAADGSLPSAVGSADYVVCTPRPGLEVYSFSADFDALVGMVSENMDERPYLWIAMNYSGASEYEQSKSLSGSVVEGHGYLGFLHAEPIRLHCGTGRHYAAGIAITQERLRAIFQDQIDDCRIEKFIEGRFSSEVLTHRLTDTMHRIGAQIHGNPYEGMMRDVYLEGKALEVLAESFRVAFDGERRVENGNARRCAFNARDIMMRDLRSPPFIADVAKAVGISQRKLIEVFREVFGATPLQCLVRWRLERARLLLQDGSLSVKQVSYMVGYNYESNFSLAFTRCFGFSPSSLSRRCDR